MSEIATSTDFPPPISRDGEQVNFTFKLFPGEKLADFCRRMWAALREQRAEPLLMLAYGRLEVHPKFCESLKEICGRLDWPVTWVEGSDCQGSSLAGVQVFGFTGKIDRIAIGDKPVASIFTEGGLRQCLVGGLAPEVGERSRGEQTAFTLDQLQKALRLAGFDLEDVIRTWFFLDDILDWYDEFNQARTKIYSAVKFRTGSLPASTGVGARNANGGAIALAAWAVQPESAGLGAMEIASPLQCPAPAYGSSFSRAMEITTATGRRLLISGTASIAPGGKTVWHNDVSKQIELTMDVVAAILRSRGLTLADLTRATAYFKHSKDSEAFAVWAREHRISDALVVSTQCAVCRDDLLFELEADASASI